VKLLFVCTGNICRSAMAEFLARKIATDRGVTVEARSCGVAAETFYRVPPEVWTAIKADGVVAAEHKPQLVSRPLLAWADWALVMTREHRAELLDAFPEHAGKIRLLREHAGLGGEVADPYGSSLPAYVKSRAEIYAALDKIIAAR